MTSHNESTDGGLGLFILVAVPLFCLVNLTCSVTHYLDHLATPPRESPARPAVPSCALRKPAAGETEAVARVPYAARPATLFERLRPLYDAIRQVESAGNDCAVGDDGKSRGPYQITRAYWKDACEAAGESWDYDTHVWDRDRCEYLMYHYWKRYCPRALATLDFETLARVHNGGPDGARERCTLDYWKRVEARLAE